MRTPNTATIWWGHDASPRQVKFIEVATTERGAAALQNLETPAF